MRAIAFSLCLLLIRQPVRDPPLVKVQSGIVGPEIGMSPPPRSKFLAIFLPAHLFPGLPFQYQFRKQVGAPGVDQLIFITGFLV
jgi:hypothetical protein